MAQYVLSLYILVVLTFTTYVMWLVYLQTNTRYIHFWTLRASTHERPPCVLRHTGNAYAVSHIFTHTLPSAIEMAPRRSTLNGQRCIRHNNVFTSRTLALRDRFTSRNIDLRDGRDHNHTVRNPQSISGGR